MCAPGVLRSCILVTVRKVKVTSLEEKIIDRVTRARAEAGLTHKEVGTLLSLSETGYGHYERKRQPFTVDQLFQLSRILNRSVEWLLGLESNLTDKEDRLVTAYRTITSDRIKAMLLRSAEDMARDELEYTGGSSDG